MSGEPTAGDAFGETLRAAAEDPSVMEIVERDDGWIRAGSAQRYFAGPDDWSALDRRGLVRLDAPTLDIGAGAGRLALALQDRGVPVTALDVSPAAMQVAQARGVRATVCATIEEYAATAPGRFDRFALYGNNLGLLGSRTAAAVFLDALASLARPGAIVVAEGTDPYGTAEDVHLAYHEYNRAAGRLPGQLRFRLRYKAIATDWFDYLLCTPAELAELLHGTAWQLSEVDDTDAPLYLAILRRT